MKSLACISLVCAAVFWPSVVRCYGEPSRLPIKRHLHGHITPEQVMTFLYEPFDVPPGVNSIYVLQNYTDKSLGNSLDIGIFDVRGHRIADAQNGTSGWRGWSGGARSNFTITPAWATPGYNPGPIQPGTWYVTLDIELGYNPVHEYFSTDYASTSLDPFPNAYENETWLRGDFHLHSIYSDGHYLPEEQIMNAVHRDLDFMFFTEHNTYSGNDVYGTWSSLAPDLLIGRGIEVTTRHGHWQALGVDRGQMIEWRYDPGDNPGLLDAMHQVRRGGGLVSINHPFQLCSRCNWGFNDYDHNDALEVWNGQWDPTDELAVQKWQELLVSGKQTTGIGGSDAHSFPDVTALPTTVVRTRGKNQADILDAVKKGHAYLVRDPGMSLDFLVHVGNATAQMGDKIPSFYGNAKAILLTTGLKGLKACFVSEKGCFSNRTISSATMTQSFADVRFVRVEIRNATDAMVGLTNPVYFV
ncbi:PHP domain protein [Rhizodiscina lignyota]|uniref:PHP domain protein n=1 Tax=Rhizodiscina lignyota TaxID=1504668 RepID=A0A9P4I0F2_9PEZI|nr:PHP domain protein [Rhizodiscina lignyota]